MEIVKGTVRASAFVGVFCAAGDEVALVSHGATDREARVLEKALDVAVVRCSLANSSLIGIFCRVLGNKVAVTDMAKEKEKKALEAAGLDVFVVERVSAVGNLLALNGKGGIVSPLLGEAYREQFEGFYGVPFKQATVAGLDVVGSACTVTNKGFIVHPGITPEKFDVLEEVFGVSGATATANYGDPFVGNSVIGNSSAAVVGAETSGHELIRIDEGLRGHE